MGFLEITHLVMAPVLTVKRICRHIIIIRAVQYGEGSDGKPKHGEMNAIKIQGNGIN
jgi:hypothetical protein